MGVGLLVGAEREYWGGKVGTEVERIGWHQALCQGLLKSSISLMLNMICAGRSLCYRIAIVWCYNLVFLVYERHNAYYSVSFCSHWVGKLQLLQQSSLPAASYNYALYKRWCGWQCWGIENVSSLIIQCYGCSVYFFITTRVSMAVNNYGWFNSNLMDLTDVGGVETPKVWLGCR